MPMKKLLLSLISGALLTSAVGASADARRRDQDEAFAATILSGAGVRSWIGHLPAEVHAVRLGDLGRRRWPHRRDHRPLGELIFSPPNFAIATVVHPGPMARIM
jgi:hypothetical protein